MMYSVKEEKEQLQLLGINCDNLWVSIYDYLRDSKIPEADKEIVENWMSFWRAWGYEEGMKHGRIQLQTELKNLLNIKEPIE